METNNRRDFLKKAALAGASALVAPSLFAADGCLLYTSDAADEL